ncbi:MAG: 3-phosphoglycerate dehydrogenase, partial [Boseongicola sp. SB0675_bin_26]|nr:3-phosphoglycerate dehydrogenase [Boseongicola sp. SB0675_bin_26]
HVPLTDQTRHLINADRLARMKTGAVVINAARGGVVDDAALAEALHQGQIAGAALDVFETEPLTQDAAQVFAGIHNLVLTPHIAGVTKDSNVRVSAMIADHVLDRLA